MAVLPAPKKKRYSTFIFSTKKNYSRNDIKILLKKYFNNSHCFIELDKKINYFPINPHISKNLDNNHLLIGDTVNLFTVAGQGWNLGIKDIQELLFLVETTSLENIDFTNLYYLSHLIILVIWHLLAY